MKKKSTVNVGNTKKSKDTDNQSEMKTKADNKMKIDYPSWTTPEHLNEKDHKALKRVFELHKERKFDVALHFASDLDTLVREEIPLDIWTEIGGKLTSQSIESDEDSMEKVHEVQTGEITIDSDCVQDSIKREKVLSEEFKESEEPINQDNVADSENVVVIEVTKKLSSIHFSYIFKNEKLDALSKDYSINTQELIEATFYSKSDMEDFIIQHHKTLFGENTVVLDNTKSSNEYFPSLFLFDFNDREKPRLYILEVNISNDSLNLLYARVTHFIASLKHKKYQSEFLVEFCNVVYANSITHSELRSWMYDDQEISDLLSYMMSNKPAVIILRESENVVLDLMQTVYADTWGKMTRQIRIKKFYCKDDAVFSVSPLFSEIWKSDMKSKKEAVRLTESDILCELPDRIRKIYSEIKLALLEVDGTLEFNPKKHYISIRKKKNLAFLHLRRKQADIVIMNPEESTRELIKFHKIKSLPASVQKFWNGECCTVVVENAENLEEVIELLKLVVMNIVKPL